MHKQISQTTLRLARGPADRTKTGLPRGCVAGDQQQECSLWHLWHVGLHVVKRLSTILSMHGCGHWAIHPLWIGKAATIQIQLVWHVG